jgi:hypothetical protein
VRFSWPALARDHVVLDADAAEFLQLLDSRPLDHPADRLLPCFVQQLVDEIDAGLHGHHEPVLQLARQAQERMVVGALDLLAVGRSLGATHVVHLQP